MIVPYRALTPRGVVWEKEVPGERKRMYLHQDLVFFIGVDFHSIVMNFNHVEYQSMNKKHF